MAYLTEQKLEVYGLLHHLGVKTETENPINLAISCMNDIKEYKAEKTKRVFITKKMEESVQSLVICHFYIKDQVLQKDKTAMLTEFAQQSIENKTVDIFCELCTEILKSGESYVVHEIKENHIDVLIQMLVYLTNSSNDNFYLSGIIARKKDFLTIASEKLQEWKDHLVGADIEKEKDKGGHILILICGILHNISIFEEYVPYVRDVNCIEAMKPYLESKDNTLRLLCLATIADLVNEIECEILKSKSDVIEFLMATISKAMNNEYQGWSVKELARIVQRVARNDSNKRTVVEHGAVPLLINIIGRDNPEEQNEAVLAIWELSFDNQNREEMISNKENKVIETLKKLSESQNEDVKKNSKYALWTINQDNKRKGQSKLHKIAGSGHIMLSYNCGYRQMVQQIRTSLEGNSIKTWMDIHNLKGSMIQAMAEAVQKADIVLVCYSSKYKNSLYCRAEAEYAFELGKTIIPLKMEKDYKPDGWLGMIIACKLHYDFSGKDAPEDKAHTLIRAILNDLNGQHSAKEVSEQTVHSHSEVQKTQQHPLQSSITITVMPVLQICLCLFLTLLLLLCMLNTTWCYNSSIKVCPYKECQPTSLTSEPGMSDEKPISNQDNAIYSAMNWTLSQVEKWLKDKILKKDTFVSKQKQLKALRGKDVAFLKLLIRECPSTFYQTITEQLGMNDIQSMSDFRFALEDIDTELQYSSKQVISTKTVETKVRLTV